MTKPPTPDTSHGRVFGLYGDDIAIRWSRETVERCKDDLDSIAKRISDAIHDDGRSFMNSCTVRYGKDEITFWANLHVGSGYYLVNAFLREAGVWYPVPARADVLDSSGWDIDRGEPG